MMTRYSTFARQSGDLIRKGPHVERMIATVSVQVLVAAKACKILEDRPDILVVQIDHQLSVLSYKILFFFSFDLY